MITGRRARKRQDGYMGIARSSAHAQPVDFHQACQPPFTIFLRP
jgi:hypothetical protein